MAGFTRLAAVAATAAVVAWAGYGVTAFATPPPPQPDLTASAVGAADPTVGAGSSTTVSFTVSNVGTDNASEPWSDTVYLSADTTVDGTDVVLASVPRVSDLAAGGSYNVSVPVTVPVGTAPGNYHLLVATDSGNAVTESDETNNVSGQLTVLNVGAPDLTLGPVSVLSDAGGSYRTSANIFTSADATGVGTGGTINVNYPVANDGLGLASQPWTTQVWLSRDNHLDAGDVLLDSTSQTSNLLAGTHIFIERDGLTIPVNTPPGSYHIIVRVDSGDQVLEQPSTDGGADGNANNTATAYYAINVGAPDLTLGPVSVLSDAGGSYRTSANIFTSADATGVGTGGTINVNYPVANDGLGLASQPWTTQVWLSRDNHLDAGDVLLDSTSQTSNLLAGTHIFIERDGLTIPVNTPPGSYHIIVRVDSGDQVLEQPSTDGGADGNANNTATAYYAINVGAPDLTLGPVSVLSDAGGSYRTSANIFTSADATGVGTGGTINVNYPVANDGLGLASQPWTTQVWLSRDNHLDAGDVLLDSTSQTSNLLAGTHIFIERDGLTIPVNTPPGSYHIIVRVDSGDQVLEQPSTDGGADGNANNTATAYYAINVGAPDLTLGPVSVLSDAGGSYRTSANIFTSADATGVGTGGTINVNYPVANDGLGLASQPWTTQVWLSRDNHLDAGDVLLDSTSQTSNLLAGTHIFIERDGLTIPVNTPPGSYHIIVRVDSGDQVLEQPSTDGGADGNANNTATAYYAINVGAPDLTLGPVDVSSDAGGQYRASHAITTSADAAGVGAGSPINVTYPVVNGGLGVASQPWTNQVWLSRDNHLDAGDVLLDSTSQTSNMLAGTSMFIERDGLAIPVNTPPGTYRIIVKLDSGDRVLEQPSTDGGADGNANNTALAYYAINVGAPDLTFGPVDVSSDAGGQYRASHAITTSAGSAGTSIGAGTPIDVTYPVVNGGLGLAQQPWTNQVWLSRDNHLDAGDVLLDSNTQTSNMAAGTSIFFERDGLTIPANTPPGLYRIIVRLDSGDQLVEQPSVDGGADGNANNTALAYYDINVGGPDLQTATPTVGFAPGSSFAIPGGTVTVNYTVGNLGTGIAVAPWDDKIYLSADGALDGGDPLVGTVTHAANLAGSGTYTVTGTSVTIPAGTPDGTYRLIVVADGGHAVTESDETNNAGISASFAIATVTVSPATLPTPVLDAPYSQSVTATGGTAPYVFTVSSGSLPSGLALNAATGAITGAANVPGPYSFTVRATESGGASATQSYSGTIANIVLSVAPGAIPHATQGTPYSQTLTASGGNGTYAFDVSAGALPSGITLSAAGTIAGTTTAHGSFSFTARATDGNGRTGTQAYTLTVDYPAITVAPASIPDGSVGHAYSQTLTASGGTAPYTFAVTAGSLPAGVTLATGGVLSGTPTASGPFAFTVTATDANGAPGQLAYTLSIAADTTAPVSTINATPAPPASGWNTANVTVTITATDDVSGVHEIDYSATGAQSIPVTTVPGATASFVISTDGSTTITYHAVDNASNSEAPKTLTIKLDKTNPVVVCAAADAAWHGSNVSLACTAHDDASGLANAADSAFTLSTTVANGATNANAATGSRSVCDTAGHCVTAGPIAGNKIDRQAPAITLTKPTSGAVYTVGQAVAASYSCLDAGVGGGTCTGTVANGANINTASTGTKTFAVTATDTLGNTTTTSVTYSVSYPFTGFFGLSSSGLNGVEAGDPVTLWFSLGGNRGLSILAAGQPTSVPISCTTRAVLGASSPTSGSLSYSGSTGWYAYRWTTSGSWKYTCRRFSMTLADGTTHTADFRLDK